MVPLADIFNHKASIVSLSDEYIVAEDTRQEEEEQESGGDDSDEAGDVEEEEEDCGDDDKDEMPMLFSAGQRPPPILGPDIDALASGLRLEIGICSLNEEDALQVSKQQLLPAQPFRSH